MNIIAQAARRFLGSEYVVNERNKYGKGCHPSVVSCHTFDPLLDDSIKYEGVPGVKRGYFPCSLFLSVVLHNSKTLQCKDIYSHTHISLGSWETFAQKCTVVDGFPCTVHLRSFLNGSSGWPSMLKMRLVRNINILYSVFFQNDDMML